MATNGLYSANFSDDLTDKSQKSAKPGGSASGSSNLQNNYDGKYDLDGYLNFDNDAPVKTKKHRREARKRSVIEEQYPNKFIVSTASRVYVLNTLFNLPETYILACLVKYFDELKNSRRESNGVQLGDVFVSYKSIFQDVRAAVDWVHFHGDMKKLTVANMDKYVHKDQRLPILLDRIRQRGSKTFLLTNSDYWYTNEVMKYLLDDGERSWTTYFNFVNVDASKPLWFGEGTVYRQVETRTGALKIGELSKLETFRADQVYSGGSCQVFSKMIGCRGKDVLYVGDHIFGDVLRSKKGRGWRTFLVVPELAQELRVWTERQRLFEKLETLDMQMADTFKNLDSTATVPPDVSAVRRSIQEATHEMDMSYGMLGSLFRSGSRQTFFASQVERYADLYASTCCNLMYYPFFYFFRAPSMLMPHESTVLHEDVAQTPSDDEPLVDGFPGDRSRTNTSLSARGGPDDDDYDDRQLMTANEICPSIKEMQTNAITTTAASITNDALRATTPLKLTYVHEDQEEDDTSLSRSPAYQQSLQKFMKQQHAQSPPPQQQRVKTPEEPQDGEAEIEKKTGIEDVVVLPGQDPNNP